MSYFSIQEMHNPFFDHIKNEYTKNSHTRQQDATQTLKSGGRKVYVSHLLALTSVWLRGINNISQESSSGAGQKFHLVI